MQLRAGVMIGALVVTLAACGAREPLGEQQRPASEGQQRVAAPAAQQPPAGALPLEPARGAVAQALSTPAAQPASPPGEQAPLPPGLFERLRDDLAARAGVDPAAVSLAGAEAVVWNDGALGCRRAGVSYTPQPVEGLRVLLEAAGRRYDYRAPATGAFLLCE